jgi:hypothetical protein
MKANFVCSFRQILTMWLAQAGLKLRTTCLGLSSAGITGVHPLPSESKLIWSLVPVRQALYHRATSPALGMTWEGCGLNSGPESPLGPHPHPFALVILSWVSLLGLASLDHGSLIYSSPTAGMTGMCHHAQLFLWR